MGFFDKLKGLFDLDSFYSDPETNAKPADVVTPVDGAATPVLEGGDTQPVDPAATRPDLAATNPVPAAEPVATYSQVQVGEETPDALRDAGAPQGVADLAVREPFANQDTVQFSAMQKAVMEVGGPTTPIPAARTEGQTVSDVDQRADRVGLPRLDFRTAPQNVRQATMRQLDAVVRGPKA